MESLHQAYGPAVDVPDQLRALRSAAVPVRRDALSALFGNVYHRSTGWAVSCHVGPLLVALADDPDTRTGRRWLWPACFGRVPDETRGTGRAALRLALRRAVPAYRGVDSAYFVAFMATQAAAQTFGATADTILIAALVLNLALPVAGVLLARLVRDRYWTRHFVWSLVGMALVYFAVSIAGNSATAPLIGWTPADQEPAPRITRCIPISGGHGCPGG